jgi:hypothetical protein
VTSVKGQSKLMFKQQTRSSLVAMRCVTGVMIHFVRSLAPSRRRCLAINGRRN